MGIESTLLPSTYTYPPKILAYLIRALSIVVLPDPFGPNIVVRPGLGILSMMSLMMGSS
jgi:hypothetical protein